MLRTFRNVLLTVASVFAVATPVLVPVGASALDEIQSNLCKGSDLSVSGTGNCSADASTANERIDSILKTVINILSLVVGVVAVIMIIIGGLRYITSGGESSNVSTAKNTIIYAIVGLVIVALAQFIVHFVLGKVTGIQ